MKKKTGRCFGTILLCNLFLTLTVAFFSPMEVYLLNIVEFYFPFQNVWWLQLLVALGAGLALSLVMFLLPRTAGRIAAAIPLGLGLGAYIQAMFLNGSMVSLTGARMRLSQEQKTGNLVIWGAILLAVLLCVILLGWKKGRLTENLMKWVAGALIAMQAVAFMSLVLTTDLSEKKLNQYLSVDGQFEMADETNAVEFVLDTVDGIFVRDMLETYPEVYDALSGWTYYPNATSTHSRTYPSITYMLSGVECHFDLPADDYVESAFEESSYLQNLHDAGVDARVFTWDPEMVGSAALDTLSNSSGFRYNQFENLNLPKLIENMIRMGLYKSLPYAYKNDYAYTLVQVNFSSYLRPELFTREFNTLDPMFYEDLTKYDPMTVTSKYHKAFRFYHLFGTHPGVDWDENLEPVSDEDPEFGSNHFRAKALRGSFKMIEAYIEQLKALGIYDQTTIIITADHGMSDDESTEETLVRDTPSCPIMMVKYAGSDTSKPLEISEAPVAHEDIFATVEQALGAPVTGTGSGKAMNEYAEGEERNRYYLHSVFRSDERGEIALREYLIDGDAENFENWHLTGRWWDIVYTMNSKSSEEFDGSIEGTEE